MIAKKIGEMADLADNYTQLALSIAAASEQGEKLARFWIANCGAGEDLTDLDPALAEIEAARKLRATVKDKTDHQRPPLAFVLIMAHKEALAVILGVQDPKREGGKRPPLAPCKGGAGHR